MANSAIVGTLKVLLTANTAEFETAMKGVGKDLDALGGKATTFGGLVKGLGPMLAGVFTIGAITKLTGDFIEMSGALVDLEAKTGLSVGALQRLKGATEQSGVALDTVAAASLQLSKRLGEGKDSTLGALTALGLKYQEIRKLSPEEQFLAVGDALGKIGDQNQKVALTNELLGKQGSELLPALNGHLKETAAAYEKLGLVLSDEVVRAGDELGDQWTVLQSTGKALLAQVIGPMVPGLVAISKEMTYLASIALPSLREGFDSLIEFSLRAQVRLFELATAGAEVAAKMPTLRTLFGESAKDVAYFKDQTQIARDTLAGFVASGVEPTKKALSDTKPVVGAVGESLHDMEERLKAAAAAAKRAAEEARRFHAAWSGEDAFNAARKLTDEIGRLGGAFTLTDDEQKRALSTLQAAIDKYDALGQSAPADVLAITVQLDAMTTRLKDATAEAFTFGQTIDHVLTMPLPPIPTLGARPSANTPSAWLPHPPVAEMRAAGVQVAGPIMEGITDSMKQLGPTIIGALMGGGKVIESVGAVLGQGLTSGLAKAMKGTLTTVLGPVFGEMVGGLISAAGALLGPLLGKLFGGVSKEVKESRTALEGFQKTLRGNLTETQKQEAGTEGWKMDVIAVRDAYLATGRTAAEAEAIVKQMWNTDDPAKSKAAIEEINLVLKEQGQIAADNEAAATAATAAQEAAAAARVAELDGLKGKLAELKEEATVDFEDMAAAAKRFGIDVDSLGPKFQGERIAAGAQDIVDTFDMLTTHGASVGGVLFGMREEINALVKDALKFGTELPANMKPWIDELVRSGNLVDENGDALTDISKLQFGKPVESKLDSVNRQIEEVTQKIEELTSKIGDDLVAAFEKLPKELPIKVTFTVPDLNLPGAGDANIHPVPLAGGGIVTAPTLALIGEGRSPEAVIPLDRLRDTGAGGGIVVLPFIPITDPYLAAEEGARQFARRVAGDSHGMREALEQVIDDWMRTYNPVTS